MLPADRSAARREPGRGSSRRASRRWSATRPTPRRSPAHAGKGVREAREFRDALTGKEPARSPTPAAARRRSPRRRRRSAARARSPSRARLRRRRRLAKRGPPAYGSRELAQRRRHPPRPSPSPSDRCAAAASAAACRFELTAPFRRANYCHCSRCRKASGGAAMAQGRVPRAGVSPARGRGADRVVPAGGRDGEGLLLALRLEPLRRHLARRARRSRCGSGRSTASPLSAPATTASSARRPAWEVLPDDGLPRFDARPRGLSPDEDRPGASGPGPVVSPVACGGGAGWRPLPPASPLGPLRDGAPRLRYGARAPTAPEPSISSGGREQARRRRSPRRPSRSRRHCAPRACRPTLATNGSACEPSRRSATICGPPPWPLGWCAVAFDGLHLAAAAADE